MCHSHLVFAQPNPAPPNEPQTVDDQGQPASPSDKPPEPPTEIIIMGTVDRQTSGSAHVMKKKQLERFEYDDPHQVLLSVPGVYVRGEDGFGLRPNIGIRGAASDRSKKITLMEDGILFGPAPYSAPAAYYFPLITRMQSVRIIKGPAAIVYGPHTVGGAIDLVTASIPSDRSGMIDIATGQFGYRKAHVRYGALEDQYGFLIEGVHVGSSGFKEIDLVGGDTGFVRNEWMIKGRHIVNPTAKIRNEFEIKVGYSDETSNETYLGLTDADFAKNPYRRYASSQADKMQWHRTQVQLAHKVSFSPNMSFTTTVYRHDLQRIWNRVQGLNNASLYDVMINPNEPRNAVYLGVIRGDSPSTRAGGDMLIGPNDRAFVSQGIQTLLSWSPTLGPTKHKIELGTRVHNDSVTRLHTQNSFQVEGGQMIAAQQPIETTAKNDVASLALAIHVADAISIGRLTVTPGVRAESILGKYSDALTGEQTRQLQQVVLPGVGVFYGITKELGVLAGVNQGFSPVAPGTAASAKPEKSMNYETGVRYSPGKIRAEVIGFYNHYTNLTNQCTFSNGCTQDGVDQQFNAGRVRVYGLEAFFESEAKITNTWVLPARVSYTFTDARFLTSFESADPTFGTVQKGDELPYVPRHQLSTAVGIESQRFGLNMAGTVVSPMREKAGQGDIPANVKTDGYFLLDASASARVISTLSLYINARNLLDNEYLLARRPFGARPGNPRWIQVGAKFTF